MKLIHVGIYTAIGVGAFLVVATINILIYSQSAKVDKSLADEFKSNLQTPMKLMIIHVGIYTAIGMGAFLEVTTINFLFIHSAKVDKSLADEFKSNLQT